MEENKINEEDNKQQDVVIERHRTPSARETMPSPGKMFKLIFGIIMATIYIAMGVWLAGWIDFGEFRFPYGFDGTGLEWIKHLVGAVLVIYGIFRAIRFFKGNDYYTR